jgi:starch phosphorylase
MEASGTSGMKVVVNGGINLSVLDGWWCEAYERYNGHNTGWAIGGGEEYEDHSYQDEVEGRMLYELLENEVVPTFYKRGHDGLPREWIAMIKASMQKICPVFNTNRMVEEYTERFYLPSILQWNWLAADTWAEARKLAEWKRRVRKAWNEVKFVALGTDQGKRQHVGDRFRVRAVVDLGSLAHNDVNVELYHGPLNPEGEIHNESTLVLRHQGRNPDGHHVFEGSIACSSTGQHGFTLRILPYNRGLLNKFETGLITWIKEPFQRIGFEQSTVITAPVTEPSEA